MRKWYVFLLICWFGGFPVKFWAQSDSIIGKMTFDSYWERVERQNLEYLADSLNISIADAGILAASVCPDPSLEFEGSDATYKVGVSYSLELGKRKARVRLATSQADADRLSVGQHFQDLRSQAAELFLDAILQRELLQVQKDSYQYMLRLYQSDSIRYSLGEITENDMRQSRLESVMLLNRMYDQEAAYRSSLVTLNYFMGCTADTLYAPTGTWNRLERDFVLADLLAAGQNNRIDLQAASKNIEMNTHAYRLVKAERRPDIGLSLSYEKDWGSFLPQARYMTVGVSVPLTFSAINKGALHQARFKVDQAVLSRKDLEMQIQAEINRCWYSFVSEKKKVSQYRNGVLQEAQKVLEGMVYKYKRGESSILDVLIAQRSYNEIQQDYLETMKSYVSSLVLLEHACGIWDISF